MGPPPGQCWVSRTWAGGSEEARHRPRCLRRQDEPSLGPGAGEAPTLPPGLWRSALPPSCVYLPATPQLCSAGPVPEPSSTRTPTKIAKILGFWVCWDTIRQLLRQFLCQNKTFSPEKFLQSATPPPKNEVSENETPVVNEQKSKTTPLFSHPIRQVWGHLREALGK